MSDVLMFFVLSLGCYRVSRMIAQEEGPFRVFWLIRDRFPQKNWVSRGLHCTLCVSFWLAWLFGLAYIERGLLHYVWFGLAISGMCVFLYQQERR